MAAPTPTTRVAPTGIKLERGYQCLITIALKTNIDFWEVNLTPPGFEGGEPIDQTTQFNSLFMTYLPQALINQTPVNLSAAYDPVVINQLFASGAKLVLNVNTTITFRFGDGSTIAFYGWLRSFIPQEVSPPNQPRANIVIQASNFDPVNRVEAGPAVTSVAGT